MPTYDYQCGACGHEWELFQSMNDSLSKAVPNVKNAKPNACLDWVPVLSLKELASTRPITRKETGRSQGKSSSDSISSDSGSSDKSSPEEGDQEESKPKKEKATAA